MIRKNTNNNRLAFTLLELLAVITVVSTITALLAYGVLNVIDRSRVIKLKKDIASINAGINLLKTSLRSRAVQGQDLSDIVDDLTEGTPCADFKSDEERIICGLKMTSHIMDSGSSGRQDIFSKNIGSMTKVNMGSDSIVNLDLQPRMKSGGFAGAVFDADSQQFVLSNAPSSQKIYTFINSKTSTSGAGSPSGISGSGLAGNNQGNLGNLGGLSGEGQGSSEKSQGSTTTPTPIGPPEKIDTEAIDGRLAIEANKGAEKNNIDDILKELQNENDNTPRIEPPKVRVFDQNGDEIAKTTLNPGNENFNREFEFGKFPATLEFETDNGFSDKAKEKGLSKKVLWKKQGDEDWQEYTGPIDVIENPKIMAKTVYSSSDRNIPDKESKVSFIDFNPRKIKMPNIVFEFATNAKGENKDFFEQVRDDVVEVTFKAEDPAMQKIVDECGQVYYTTNTMNTLNKSKVEKGQTANSFTKRFFRARDAFGGLHLKAWFTPKHTKECERFYLSGDPKFKIIKSKLRPPYFPIEGEAGFKGHLEPEIGSSSDSIDKILNGDYNLTQTIKLTGSNMLGTAQSVVMLKDEDGNVLFEEDITEQLEKYGGNLQEAKVKISVPVKELKIGGENENPILKNTHIETHAYVKDEFRDWFMDSNSFGRKLPTFFNMDLAESSLILIDISTSVFNNKNDDPPNERMKLIRDAIENEIYNKDIEGYWLGVYGFNNKFHEEKFLPYSQLKERDQRLYSLLNNKYHRSPNLSLLALFALAPVSKFKELEFGTSYSAACEGLTSTIERIKSEGKPMPQSIYFFSDGAPEDADQENQYLKCFTSLSQNYGIKINVIGLVKETDSIQYLQNVSDASGGRFIKIQNFESKY